MLAPSAPQGAPDHPFAHDRRPLRLEDHTGSPQRSWARGGRPPRRAAAKTPTRPSPRSPRSSASRALHSTERSRTRQRGHPMRGTAAALTPAVLRAPRNRRVADRPPPNEGPRGARVLQSFLLKPEPPWLRRSAHLDGYVGPFLAALRFARGCLATVAASARPKSGTSKIAPTFMTGSTKGFRPAFALSDASVSRM